LGGKEGPTVKAWESLSSFSPNSGLVVWCKLKKGQQEIRSLDISEKEILSNYDETKSKGAKRQNNGSKKNAHRGQSVWWKQGNIKMAVSENHAS